MFGMTPSVNCGPRPSFFTPSSNGDQSMANSSEAPNSANLPSPPNPAASRDRNISAIPSENPDWTQGVAEEANGPAQQDMKQKDLIALVKNYYFQHNKSNTSGTPTPMHVLPLAPAPAPDFGMPAPLGSNVPFVLRPGYTYQGLSPNLNPVGSFNPQTGESRSGFAGLSFRSVYKVPAQAPTLVPSFPQTPMNPQGAFLQPQQLVGPSLWPAQGFSHSPAPEPNGSNVTNYVSASPTVNGQNGQPQSFVPGGREQQVFPASTPQLPQTPMHPQPHASAESAVQSNQCILDKPQLANYWKGVNFENPSPELQREMELENWVFGEVISRIQAYACNPNIPNAEKVYSEMSNLPTMEGKWSESTPVDVQLRAHRRAKRFLTEALSYLPGGGINFVSAPRMQLDKDYIARLLEWTAEFQWAQGITKKRTEGVYDDIKQSALANTDPIVVYAAASQFNLAEQGDRKALNPGRAAIAMQYDDTQGPQAQLAFSRMQVEIINFASNLGYNALLPALLASGKAEELKGVVCNGYFTPRNPKETEVLNDVLLKFGQYIQYGFIMGCPMISNPLTPYLQSPGRQVGLFLVSAPAFGQYSFYGCNPDQEKDLLRLQFRSALLGFRAQLDSAIKLAKKTNRPVKLNAVAVGLGAFNNDGTPVGRALRVALFEHQNEMRDANVTLALQVYWRDWDKPESRAQIMAEQARIFTISE